MHKWKNECSLCKREATFYENRDDLMTRIYHSRLKKGENENIEKTIEKIVVGLQQKLLSIHHLCFGSINGGALCFLLTFLGAHFVSSWNSWKAFYLSSPNQRIDYHAVLLKELPAIPAPVTNVIVEYLVDFLFLIGEKVDYPEIKKRFGTKQNPHPNVSKLLREGGEKFTGLTRQLFLPEKALCQLDAESVGKWHCLDCLTPGCIGRYIAVCKSCLLERKEIGTLHNYTEIKNLQRPNQVKILQNNAMFLPEEDIAQLVTKWMLGTNPENLKNPKVHLLPVLCGYLPEFSTQALMHMLKSLNDYLPIKSEFAS